MPRPLITLIAQLLPAIIPLALLAACASSPAREAEDACEAARRGDIIAAVDAANRAYADFDHLSTDDLCRLAASYAVIALTSGDINAADRFEYVYKASLESDPGRANQFYASLDPNMAEGLRIVAGLFDGKGIYTRSPEYTAHNRHPQVSPEIAAEALAED